MSLTNTADLDPGSSVSGASWREGVLLQTIKVVNDAPGALVGVEDGVARARAELQGQGLLLQPGGPGLPFGGERFGESDLEAGTPRLGWRNGYAAWPAQADHMASVTGRASAAIMQTFEVRWALDHSGPAELQLSMTVYGTVLRNDGWMAGLGVHLSVGHVDTGLPPNTFPVNPMRRYETSVDHDVISAGGSFVNSHCGVRLGYCESYFNIFAVIGIGGRNLDDGRLLQGQGAASEFDFGHTVQLAQNTSPGLQVLRVDNLGQELPMYAWVNAATVPEPASVLLMAAGQAGLGWRVRKSREEVRTPAH